MSPLSKRGFTLVELLTVIAIIGVLAAIVLVTVGRVRESANSARCQSNLRNIGQAVLMYANDNNGYYPPVNSAVDNEGKADGKYYWQLQIAPYYVGLPSAWSSVSGASDNYTCRTHLSVMKSAFPNANYTHNYAMNFTLGATSGVKTRRRKVNQIPNPSSTLMVTEANYTGATANSSMDIYEISQLAAKVDGGVHGGANNILWCDGRVTAFYNIGGLIPSAGAAGVGKGTDKYWSPGYENY